MSLTTNTLKGHGVGRGAAYGMIIRAHGVPTLPAHIGTDIDVMENSLRIDDVARTFTEVSQRLMDQAALATNSALADVLDAAAAMAADPELVAESVAKVRSGTHPAIAVQQATEEFVELFTSAGGYLAERITDLRSVRDRVIARLLNLPEPGVPAFDSPSILVAEDLSPADTATLDMEKVLAIVLEQGGPTGHTAIIAAQLGIPCVVRVNGAENLHDGELIAVDAATGIVERNPGEVVKANVAARGNLLRTLAENHSRGQTSDGHPVELLANIGGADDVERLEVSEVEGVGLFRTEVLFLGNTVAPTRAEQASTYERVLRARPGQKVVVRTLDAGADKPLAFIDQRAEENPALGLRGYRLVRTQPGLLTEQLDAIADAQKRSGSQPWVMAPMIASAREAAEFAAHARARGISRVGVMIEVPAAALRVKDILGEVDFVSIGTNDLAQYTMASDRLLGELADLLNPWQPAVLDLVQGVLHAARELGKPAGVCGESAADPLMALVLTGLGATSLSMAPAAVPAVRFAVSHHSFSQCKEIAAAALAGQSPSTARASALALCDSRVRQLLSLD